MSQHSSDRGRAKPFQARAADAINGVLLRAGVEAEFVVEGAVQYAEFDWKDGRYTVAVFPEELNIREGGNLYECYLPEELASESAYIEAFSQRLARLLLTGDWTEPGG